MEVWSQFLSSNVVVDWTALHPWHCCRGGGISLKHPLFNTNSLTSAHPSPVTLSIITLVANCFVTKQQSDKAYSSYAGGIETFVVGLVNVTFYIPSVSDNAPRSPIHKHGTVATFIHTLLTCSAVMQTINHWNKTASIWICRYTTVKI